MRLVFHARVLVMKAAGLLVVWLLSSSFGFAAPAPATARAGRACDAAHVTTVRKLVRHVRSFGGPVAPVSKRALAGLSDLTTLLKRGALPQLDDDDEAIQNDAPAARIDDDESRVPLLLALGVVDKSGDRAPCAGADTPRAPRGPPAPL